LTNREIDAIQSGYGLAARQAEKQPVFERGLQLFPAFLEAIGVGPNSRESRNRAVESALISENLVVRLSQRGFDISAQHGNSSVQDWPSWPRAVDAIMRVMSTKVLMDVEEYLHTSFDGSDCAF